MSFDAHEEKIRKIFAGDTRFIIPRNQRKYVWEEKQWRELLSDILYIKKRQEAVQDEINHFLGSFVLQESENKYEIIDGQQRITTLLIILSAICVIFNEYGNDEEHGRTRQNLAGNIGLKSQYIRMENDNISNIRVIIEQASEYRKNLTSKNILDPSLVDKSNDTNRKVFSCFHFYYHSLKESCSTIEDIISVREVILDMKVIHIKSKNELDCYDIFEILNARGVDLEDSELLKNYIFKYSQPKYTIDRAKEIWAKVEKNMEECNGNMEQFLSHFVTYRYYKPTKDEGVFRIIKLNTDKQSVNELLDDIFEASERYIWFYSPEKIPNRILSDCFEYFKLVNHRQFRPLFMSILEAFDKQYINEKVMNNICKYLRNFSFAFTLVMGNNSNMIDSKIHSLSKEIYNNPSEESINKIKTELQIFYPEYKEFERAFLNLGFSNKNKQYSNSNNRRRVFYILKQIEEYRQETKELVCNTDECNIEHIMNDSENISITSQIGNLLLLSEHINNKMGNASFVEKKKKLEHSKLMTVQNFLKYYRDKETWTNEMIEERTKKLAKLAYDNVWRVL